MLWPVCLFVKDASAEHFLRERHDVWAVFKVEMLMAPHLASRPAPSLDLVHHERDVVLATNLLKAL